MDEKIKIFCGNCKRESDAEELSTYVRYKCLSCKSINEVTNIKLDEWLGFNYGTYLKDILSILSQEKFSDLRGDTEELLAAGKLTPAQVEDLRAVLKKGFKEGQTIKEIADNIVNKVQPGSVYETKDGKVLRDEQGNKILVNTERPRSISIARTETTRLSAEGQIKNYKDAQIKQYRWVTSLGRSCQLCQSLNGSVYDLYSGPLPARDTHPGCRCTTVPVIKE